jgi:Protein of unknown function (DUF995)
MQGRRICLYLIAPVFALVTSMAAMAADKVKLPDTAKMLTKAEVVALYGGRKTTWEHPNTDGVTGTAEFDSELKSAKGTFNDGGKKGTWESKLSFKGDWYCYQVRVNGGKKYSKRTCNVIYVDGEKIYEVDPKSKKVLSLNQIVP